MVQASALFRPLVFLKYKHHGSIPYRCGCISTGSKYLMGNRGRREPVIFGLILGFHSVSRVTMLSSLCGITANAFGGKYYSDKIILIIYILLLLHPSMRSTQYSGNKSQPVGRIFAETCTYRMHDLFGEHSISGRFLPKPVNNNII